jgi:streptogramin lyase
MLTSLRSRSAGPLLAAALLLVSALSASAVGPAGSWGVKGTGNGQLYNPSEIAINHLSGEVYIPDYQLHRLQEFSPTGAFIKSIGSAKSSGNGTGQFNNPRGIAVDYAENVYVADSGNNRVEKFDRHLNYLAQWGGFGTGDYHFDKPVAITADHSNNIYVSDLNNHRIMKFNAAGKFAGKWSLPDSNALVYYLAIGPNDVLVAYDSKNHLFLQYSSTGSLLRTWRPHSLVKNSLGGLAVGEHDEIYANNYENNRVDVYDSTGAFIQSLSFTTLFGRASVFFLDFDFSNPRDQLYIVDFEKGAVLVGNPY